MPCAAGDWYGASTPRDFKTSVRTGSFDQNTSACGRRLLRQQPIGQAGRLRLLRVVDDVDANARLPLVLLHDRLGKRPIGRHVRRHLARRRDRRRAAAGDRRPAIERGARIRRHARTDYFEPYVKSSNAVTLSAFVQTPTLPASLNVSSSHVERLLAVEASP